jgi:hypothetical protein
MTIYEKAHINGLGGVFFAKLRGTGRNQHSIGGWRVMRATNEKAPIN